MKRLFLFGWVSALASALAGCPIYDNNDGHGRPHCVENCLDPEPECTNSNDCTGDNETCGADSKCHVGDCTVWGCPEDQACVLGEDRTSSCQEGGGGSGGAGAGGGVVYCGNPDDCSADETCAPAGICQVGDCSMIGCIFGFTCDTDATPPVCNPSDPAACGADGDCQDSGSGYACVSGICTAPADQCFDQTNCSSGQVCANGKCIASCDGLSDCPTGYACNDALGICSNAAIPCVITDDCGGPSLVCVDGACVPRSDEAICEEGLWVENGCVPSQAATFTCEQDGAQDACFPGSICLHHSCYISCESPNETACDGLSSSLDVCKPVTTSSGSHAVCGSNENLGDECDPTVGEACEPAQICIDGFCK